MGKAEKLRARLREQGIVYVEWQARDANHQYVVVARYRGNDAEPWMVKGVRHLYDGDTLCVLLN